MKKFYFIFASALVIASCSQAEIAGPDDGASSFGGTKVTFSATHETDEDPAVRTVLDGRNVNWANGDRITIIGTGGGGFATSDALSLADPAANADFSVDIPDGMTPAFAVYPHVQPGGISASTDGAAISLTVPADQTGGSFGSAAIEVSKIGPGNALAFKSLTAVLKVSISAEDIAAGVNKVSITAYGGKTIAGVAEVSFTDGLPVIDPDVTSPSSTVTLSGISAAGDYYLSILPVADLEDGFYIELKHDDTVIGQKLTGKTLTLSRRDVIGLGSIDRSLPTFVNKTGSGSGDGSSWTNAMSWDNLKSGLRDGSISGTVLMAGYTDDTVYDGTKADADHDGIAIITNISVLGGYSSESTGTDLSLRNISTCKTVFDGEEANRLFIWDTSTLKTAFDGVTFQNARASSGTGTALIINDASKVSFNNCIIKNNSNPVAGGGAVRATNAEISFSNCSFNGNSVTAKNTNGGAVYVAGATAIFNDCTFDSNDISAAANARGSAVFAATTDYTVQMNKCYFLDNAGRNGGTVWSDLSSGTLFLNDCVFYNNSTITYASAVGNRGICGINNCVFQVNSNSSTTGASNLYMAGGKCIVSNTTIRLYGNSAVAVYAASGPVWIVNSIFINTYTENDSASKNVALKSKSNINSFGHNIYSKLYQETENTYVLNNPSNEDICSTLSQTYSTEYHYTYWDGTMPDGFIKATQNRVEDALDAFDTAAGTGFKAWLTSIGALTKDIRGHARNTSALWPGSYED